MEPALGCPSEFHNPGVRSKVTDAQAHGAFAARSLSWTGNSLASSFDGCELDARSASVVAPQSLDASSQRIPEGSTCELKYCIGVPHQDVPTSLESSSTVFPAHSIALSDSVAKPPSAQHSALLSGPRPCESTFRRGSQYASIPTQVSSEMPESRDPGRQMPASVPSSPYATKSLPSSMSTQLVVEDGSETVQWLAHPETQIAVMEMLEEEAATAIDPNYMDFHSDSVMPEGLSITPAMRLMTINWMSEAVYELDLDQRVVAMSVNLLDRYLSSSRSFPRTMLQLAAAAAIFISSKIEGVLPHPRASRVATLSDGAFDLDRLIGFERVMCHSLGFDLYGPTTQNFLDMWLHALPTPVGEGEKFFVGKVHALASYLLELGSLVYDTLRHKRSLLATSALLLALGDPGLHQSVASALELRTDDIRRHAEGVVSTMRNYIGPHADVVDVTVATAELLRLHRLAKSPENREQFVIVKFGSARFGHIADTAQPMASAEDFHTFMRIYFGSKA